MNIKLNAKKKLSKRREVDSEDKQEREQADLALDAAERAALVRLCTKILDPEPGVVKLKPKTYPHNHHGVEEMFKVIMYMETEDLFFKA